MLRFGWKTVLNDWAIYLEGVTSNEECIINFLRAFDAMKK